MSEERIHHNFSPSTLQAREASPCYMPNNNETEASRLGTKQHKAYETGDFKGLTDEQCEAVETCINYSEAIRLQMNDRYSLAGQESITRLDESYLAVDDEGTTAGYIDRAYISPCRTEAHLLDCKFGKWPVEPAETNLQGICYALGLRQKYPSLRRVNVHFMMPYLGYTDAFTFQAHDFDKLLLRVRVAVARAKQWKADFDMGKQVKWYPTTGSCLFCGRQGVCEALHGVALKVSQKFSPLLIPDNFTPSLGGDTAEQANIRMRLADLMTTWGEATRRQITMRVIDGAPIPEGYKLVEGSRRSEKDNKKIRAIAKDEFGVSEAQIEAASTVALTKLEEAISDNAPRKHKGEAVESFQNRLKSAGAVQEGKPYAYLQMIKPDEDGATGNNDSSK